MYEVITILTGVLTYLLYKIHKLESRLKDNDSGFKYQETHNEDIGNYIDQILTWVGYWDDDKVYQDGIHDYVDENGSLHDRLKMLEGKDREHWVDHLTNIKEIKKTLVKFEDRMEKLEGLDLGSLDEVLKKLDGVDTGILDLAFEIGKIKKRLDSLETQVESNEDESILMNEKIDDIQNQIDTHEDELERIHKWESRRFQRDN